MTPVARSKDEHSGKTDVGQIWLAAGDWDSAHGLMPMPTDCIPPQHRYAYAVGYRRHPIGLASNAYRDANRPRSPRRRSRQSGTLTS